MTIAELTKELAQYPPDTQVMILDGFNGGGYPRDLNVFPTVEPITEEHAKACADCEGRIGEEVITIGYGCY